MKGKFFELFKKNKKIKIGMIAVVLAVILGIAGSYEISKIPELPVYTADPVMEMTIEEEEVPLAAKTTVTTTTSKKTTVKKQTLSKKATKTYSKTLPTTTKTTLKTTKSSTKTVKKQTTIKTTIKENYYKNKKYKKVTTTVVTTVKTTTIPIVKTTATSISTPSKKRYEVSVDKIAPKMKANVRQAFKKLGFKVYIDSSVSYSGYFDPMNRRIILREEDDTIYHELGHFLAFISGNKDTKSSFIKIYNAEKKKYTGNNKAYVIQNSTEYFAESVKDYVLTGSALKKARPKTYTAVKDAFSVVTTERVNKLKEVYSVIWE